MSDIRQDDLWDSFCNCGDNLEIKYMSRSDMELPYPSRISKCSKEVRERNIMELRASTDHASSEWIGVSV